MARPGKKGKSKHDEKVESIVQELQRAGWEVQADLPGMDAPDGIGRAGHVPDIVARKAGATRIVEVETPETVNTDRAQHESFRRSAGQRKRTTFQIEETD